MSKLTEKASTIPNQFIETKSGMVAYRTLGSGDPLILCNRFRGILDSWDPMFLGHLAKKHQVIFFDYHGIGLSEGQHSGDLEIVASDLKLFLEALEIKKAIIAGWSYGGIVAQTFAALYPEMTSHLVLIGSNPPGKNDVQPEQIFFDTALKPVNDFDDELILFFEPASEASIKAARESHDRIALRTTELDIPVTPEKFNNYFLGGAGFKEDKRNIREILNQGELPILVLMGDHDPSFPVENWFPLVKHSNTMQLIILSKTGHGPQHEFPKLSATYIRKFIENVK